MSRSYVGQGSILEYIMSQAVSILPEMDDNTQKLLKDSLTSYLNGALSYEQCSQLFSDCVGTTSPVDTLRSIIECKIDEPEIISSTTAEHDDFCDDGYTPGSKKKRARPWNSQEDKRLLAGILHNGTDNWSIVSDIVGPTRTRAQCSQRWLRGLDPRISKKRWNAEEDLRLMAYVEEFGDTAWAKIASSMGNRSDVQCRYHYQQLKKGARKNAKKKALKHIPNLKEMSEIPPIPALSHKIEGGATQNAPVIKARHEFPPILQTFRIEGRESAMLPTFQPLGVLDSTILPTATSSIDMFLQHFGF